MLADQPLLTTEDFPFDLDTTSIGTLATRRDDGTANLVMDEMLQYRDEDGIIQVRATFLIFILEMNVRLTTPLRHISIMNDRG